MLDLFAPPPDLSAQQQRAWRASLALTVLRLALAPVLLAIAWWTRADWPLVLALLVGLVSDVLDGRVLARAQVAAPALRTLDSAVDSVFYLAAAFAAWHRHPTTLLPFRVGVLSLVVCEVLNNVAGLLKYGRTPAYHARSARLFGACLFVSLALLLSGMAWTLLPLTIALGAIAQLETGLMTFLLPRWTCDVPSIVHAWRLRRVAV